MPTELEQRARELLAAEYERQGSRGFAEALRSGGDAGTDVFYLRAITAALQAQQPGAQAVVIPEPSGEDVDAAAIELCKRFDPSPSFDEWVSPRKKRWERYRDEARAALTTYTARLRERVGQAPGGRRRCVLTTCRDRSGPPMTATERPSAWPSGVLNRAKTLEVLTQHNAWRRGAKDGQTDPVLLGKALDAAIAHIATIGDDPADPAPTDSVAIGSKSVGSVGQEHPDGIRCRSARRHVERAMESLAGCNRLDAITHLRAALLVMEGHADRQDRRPGGGQ